MRGALSSGRQPWGPQGKGPAAVLGRTSTGWRRSFGSAPELVAGGGSGVAAGRLTSALARAGLPRLPPGGQELGHHHWQPCPVRCPLEVRVVRVVGRVHADPVLKNGPCTMTHSAWGCPKPQVAALSVRAVHSRHSSGVVRRPVHSGIVWPIQPSVVTFAEVVIAGLRHYWLFYQVTVPYKHARQGLFAGGLDGVFN